MRARRTGAVQRLAVSVRRARERRAARAIARTSMARLDAGPREDLRAIAARLARDVSRAVSAAGWRVYDRYLKANRVEAGAASYAQVVRLVLGTARRAHARNEVGVSRSERSGRPSAVSRASPRVVDALEEQPRRGRRQRAGSPDDAVSSAAAAAARARRARFPRARRRSGGPSSRGSATLRWRRAPDRRSLRCRGDRRERASSDRVRASVCRIRRTTRSP